MTVKDLCYMTCKGDYLYPAVIRRHFHDKASDVKQFLLDKGYATATLSYKCPYCELRLGNLGNKDFVDSLDNEMIYCYNCDYEFHTRNLVEETLLIRTDKKWSEDDVIGI